MVKEHVAWAKKQQHYFDEKASYVPIKLFRWKRLFKRLLVTITLFV